MKITMTLGPLSQPVSGMELGLQNGSGEPELALTLPGGHVPQDHSPVRRRAQQLTTAPVPTGDENNTRGNVCLCAAYMHVVRSYAH